MRRAMHWAIIVLFAVPALVLGQGGDVNKILADVREALGGEKKLAAVTSVTVSGRTTRVSGESSMPPTDFEFAMQLPDKYVRKDVMGVMNGTTMARTSGFNGKELIEAMDEPPAMGHGGGAMVFRMGPGGMMGGNQSPEQQAEQRKATLIASRQEFARLTLGMFATSFQGYPVTFAYAGQAEAPDGKAEVITVTGDGDFKAKLFVDAKSHLPLMLSWMGKEPLTMSVGPGGVRSTGDGRMVQSIGGGSGMSQEDLMRELDARMKEAEANRRMVEYRLYYAEYTDVGGGVKMPSKFQRSIDGKPADEQAFEKVKLNQKIDPKKFDIGK